MLVSLGLKYSGVRIVVTPNRVDYNSVAILNAPLVLELFILIILCKAWLSKL